MLLNDKIMNEIFVNFVKKQYHEHRGIRKELHCLIDYADKTFLKKVHAMIKEFRKWVQ